MCPGKRALLFVAVVLTALGQPAPKKLTRAEALGAVVSKVQPDYPPVAKQLKLQGEVDLEAVVSENGTVEQVNILSGNPVLTHPAAEALKKWKFTPFSEDGKSVKALAPVVMSFKLEH
jgi:TonB family protein